MRISEVVALSGLTIATIRYYERSSLCPPIPRGPDGKREFTPENRDWLVLLASLRDTGMPTQKMRHFAQLYQQGDATIAARKQVLVDHATHLDARQTTLEACRTLLAHKLNRYDAVIGEIT